MHASTRTLAALALAGLAALLCAEPALAQNNARFARQVARQVAQQGGYAPVAQQPVPDDLGNVHEVADGAVRYEWRRNDLKVRLADRAKRWSRAEAIWAGDSLDRLPDVFIRKALQGGMQRIYRDGALPSAPWDLLVGPTDGVAGVAVPASPWNFVALGDLAFEDGFDPFYAVFVHELGHVVQWQISGWGTVTVGTRGFTSISWASGIPATGMRSWNGFVSEYSRTTHMEDFAECAEWYWLTPDELWKANPAKYWFMRNTVFEGLVSPEEARVTGRTMADRVTPRITSLGDQKDSWGSLVKVYGQYFMAATDGGYNQVKYRGTRATHLPITRSQIWSWVPRISEGSASVTVTTQDGTSAGMGFRVEEPWWKFW